MIGETERDGLQLVTALHDVVQPAGLPVLPAFEVHGRFRVPDDAVEPGGSWFDVVVLPDDRLALVVGEVPGIGLTAAVTAAQTAASSEPDSAATVTRSTPCTWATSMPRTFPTRGGPPP